MRIVRKDWMLAVAGPAATGAAGGFPGGMVSLAAGAGQVPAVFVGVTVAMLPALYIALAMTGVAPPLARLPGVAGEALREAGIALLGLSPALVFLRATGTGVGLVFVAALLGALLAARAFWLRLALDRAGRGAAAVFGLWALVACAIGLHFLAGSLS